MDATLHTLEVESVSTEQCSERLEPEDERSSDTFKRRSLLKLSQEDWGTPITGAQDRYSVESLPEVLNSISSGKDADLLLATVMLRKMLSTDATPPVQEVVDAGVLLHAKKWIQRSDFKRLQFEASWVVTNIASGTSVHVQALIDQGFLPLLVGLLSSSNENIRDQATWALGNIAGDSSQTRDQVIKSGALPFLIECVLQTTVPSMRRNSIWAIANLCRGQPRPKLYLTHCALSALAVSTQIDDQELLVDSCWALCYLSEGDEARIQAVVDAGVGKRLCELLASDSIVQLPAVRTLGNISSGSESQTQYIIDCGVLISISPCVSSRKDSIRKEALWTLSNVAAGSLEQILAIKDAGHFPAILASLTANSPKVKKEALWIILNSLSLKSSVIVEYLLALGAVPALCELLMISDALVVKLALKSLKRMLNTCKKDAVNLAVSAIEECKGTYQIEMLQKHPNADIYRMAISVLETFFVTKED